MPHKAYCCARCHEPIRFWQVVLLTKSTLAFDCKCSPGQLITSAFNYDEDALARLIHPFHILVPYTAADTPPVPQGHLDRIHAEWGAAFETLRDVDDFLDLCAVYDRKTRNAGA